MNEYFLNKDGDPLEKEYWSKFIKKDFPSYEKYWQIFIVPLTRRPHGKHFKNIEELKKINKNEYDVYLAQLHYTIFKHLVRAYEVVNSSKRLNYDSLVEGLVRICGALDVADDKLLAECSSYFHLMRPLFLSVFCLISYSILTYFSIQCV